MPPLGDFFFESLALSILGCLVTAIACYARGDALSSGKGPLIHALFALTLGTVGAVLGALSLCWAGFFFGCETVLLLLLWGRYAAAMSHRMFAVAIVFAMLVGGIACCFLPSIPNMQISILLGWLLSAISLAFFVPVAKSFRGRLPPSCSIGESKQIESSMHVSYGPAMSDGLMTGVSLCLVHQHTAVLSSLDMIPMGFAFLAGSMLCLFQLIPNFKFGQMLRNYASCFKLVPFLLFPLTAYMHSGALACVAMTITFCYTSTLAMSLTERVNLIGLSSFYVFGRHGSLYFLAAFVAVAFVYATGALFESGSIELIVAFFVVMLIVEWLLVGSRRWGTTFDHATSLQEKAPEDDGEQPKKRRWTDKVNSIAQKYALSSRQQEVLVILAQGRNAQYIADHLCITVATAKTHIYNIYTKLGIHTQQELLDMVEREK